MSGNKSKRGNMQRPPKPEGPSERVSQLLMQQGMQLSALAWTGYQQEGRGFVLVIFDGDEISAEYHRRGGPFWTETDIIEILAGIEDLVSEYDPTREIVLASITNGRRGEFLQTEDLPLPPPLAYAKVTLES